MMLKGLILTVLENSGRKTVNFNGKTGQSKLSLVLYYTAINLYQLSRHPVRPIIRSITVLITGWSFVVMLFQCCIVIPSTG